MGGGTEHIRSGLACTLLAVFLGLAGPAVAQEAVIPLGSGNFTAPMGVAVDGAGNVFVVDTATSQLKEIAAADGSVTRLAVLNGKFLNPQGLAIDSSGNLYVADTGNNVVKQVLATGGYMAVNSFGNLVGATVNQPIGLAFDGNGNLFVASSGGGGSVIMFSPNDNFTDGNELQFTLPSPPWPPSAPVPVPNGIAFDRAGNMFITDVVNRELDEANAADLTAFLAAQIADIPLTPLQSFPTGEPFDVAVEGGFQVDPVVIFFVTDQENGTVPILNGRSPTNLPGPYNGPTGITFDAAGNIYVADTGDGLIKEVVRQSTTTLAQPTSPVVFGTSVTFTATITGPSDSFDTPDGSVTFLDNGTVLGAGSVTSGVASFSTAALEGGDHSITAQYGGSVDAAYAPSLSAAVTQTISPVTTSTMLASSLDPSLPGQSVTFTATVSGVGGTVTFSDGATPLGTVDLINGSATFTTTVLAKSTHSITASYSGTADFAASSAGPLSQQVGVSTISLISSANPSTAGQTVTFTAFVDAANGIPSGSVTFLDGATPLGSGTLANGIAQFTAAGLSAGDHSITAAYGGDDNFATSTSSALGQSVTAATSPTTTTTLSVSADPSLAGASVTFTALVAGSSGPTGSVTFYDGATSLGTGALAAGQAKLATASLAVGTHSITAAYGGDGNSTGSSSAPLTEVIEAASVAGQAYGYQNTLGVTGIAEADAAHFSSPVPGAVDAAGHHLFVADTGNNRVQVLDSATLAVVATIGAAGEAGSDNSHFDHPGGVAFDASSRHLFIVDTANQRIQIFSADDFGYLATFGATGSGAVSFDQPSNAFASTVTNQLYVADTGNHRVLVFSLSGLGLTATLGTSGTAGSDDAHLDAPQDAELDPSTNQILVADTGNRRVQVFDATSFAYVMTLGTTGTAGSDNAHFAQPMSAAFDPASNLVLVADGGANARVQVFDGMSYQYVLTLGTVGAAGPGNSQFAAPQGITADAAHRRLFIGDGANDRVQVFAIAPIATEASVLPGSRSIQLGSPATVFASVVNAGTTALDECRIALPVSAPAGLSLDYQTTDPATNALTGRPDTPATIPGAGGFQSFLVTLRSNATLATTTLPLDFDCSGAAPAVVVTGLDTVDLSVASTPVPDIIALAATASGNGIVQTTPGIAGPFAVASANVGATAPITVSADTGSAQPFALLLLCQTNPSTGQCLATPGTSTTLNFAAGATPTFSVFIEASGVVPLDPANNRVFVRFKDANGALRGSTSVAFAALPG